MNRKERRKTFDIQKILDSDDKILNKPISNIKGIEIVDERYADKSINWLFKFLIYMMFLCSIQSTVNADQYVTVNAYGNPHDNSQNLRYNYKINYSPYDEVNYNNLKFNIALGSLNHYDKLDNNTLQQYLNLSSDELDKINDIETKIENYNNINKDLKKSIAKNTNLVSIFISENINDIKTLITHEQELSYIDSLKKIIGIGNDVDSSILFSEEYDESTLNIDNVFDKLSFTKNFVESKGFKMNPVKNLDMNKINQLKDENRKFTDNIFENIRSINKLKNTPLYDRYKYSMTINKNTLTNNKAIRRFKVFDCASSNILNSNHISREMIPDVMKQINNFSEYINNFASDDVMKKIYDIEEQCRSDKKKDIVSSYIVAYDTKKILGTANLEKDNVYNQIRLNYITSDIPENGQLLMDASLKYIIESTTFDRLYSDNENMQQYFKHEMDNENPSLFNKIFIKDLWCLRLVNKLNKIFKDEWNWSI